MDNVSSNKCSLNGCCSVSHITIIKQINETKKKEEREGEEKRAKVSSIHIYIYRGGRDVE